MLLKMKKHLKNERGFTLIEMLAVILILGFLTAVAVPAVIDHLESAKIKSERSSMLIVKNAAKRYLLDNGLPALLTDFDTQAEVEAVLVGGTAHYLDAWPFKIDGTTKIGCTITNTGLITVSGTSGKNTDITGY